MYKAVFDDELMNSELRYNSEFMLNFSDHQNIVSEVEDAGVFEIAALFDEKPDFVDLNESWNTGADSVKIPDFSDFSDPCIKFLSDILLEEGLDETPTTEEEYRALQATEKSLYDALGERYIPEDRELVPSLNRNVEREIDGFDGSLGATCDVKFQHNGQINFQSKMMPNEMAEEKFLDLDKLADSFLQLNSPSSGSSNSEYSEDRVAVSSDITLTSDIIPEKQKKPVDLSRGKKDRQRDEVGYDDGRVNKVQASTNEDFVEMEEYDDVLLSRVHMVDSSTPKCDLSCNEVSEKLSEKGAKGRRTRGKKSNNLVEEVDLRGLLNQCAQAVSDFDLTRANERLKEIRRHSSPYGDSNARAAHYFANALEARMAGTGSTATTYFVVTQITSSDILKAYRELIKAVPFQGIAYFLANRTIMKFVETAKKVHIIDFGILLGMQWPWLIQALSERPGGPPELRITGIEFPQHRFRPAERVEATGRRLTGYCDRFNVPFKYQAFAQNWKTIKPEDLKTESDELVIVNCMWRSGTLLDETVEAYSSKDAFLRLVKQLNPKLFVHTVVNGAFNVPFFVTRFKETLFHYSAVFEVFEATMPREEHGRQLIESEIIGREILNIIACEGAERVYRAESYKQWQARSARIGLKQLPLDQEFFKAARAIAKANYPKDFVVHEDKNWMLQAWKGRILCAQSFWQHS